MRSTAAHLMLFTCLCLSTASAQQAVRFDVPGAYLEVPDSPTVSTPEFTIEFWVRVNELADPDVAGGEQTLFDKRGDRDGYNFRLAGDRFPLPIFALFGDNGVTAWNALHQRSWAHVAVTQSLDSLKIYLNGGLAEADTNRYHPTSTSPIRIGEFGGFPGAYLGLRGDMDEVRIWDYARPGDSLRAFMHKSLSGTEVGLMAYWDFESESNRRIPDQSASGNDAEMRGDVKLISSDAPVGFIPPPAPTCLRALGYQTSIELGWSVPEDEVAEIRVYRGDTPDFQTDESTLLASLPGADSTYADRSVVPDYNYYYRLRAVDEDVHASEPGPATLGRVFVSDEYLTGAYYFPVFDPADTSRGWADVNVREFFSPPQPPMLGHYSSRDPSVVRQHLDWMASYGIDFLVSNWWQQESWEDVTLRDYVLPEIEQSPVRFALLYLIDNFWGEFGLVIDADIQQQMLDDFDYFADTYFGHPNMLKVGERPVVFLAGSRHLQGDFVAAFDAVRSRMLNRGFDVFLVGDEFRWGVTEPGHFQILDAVTPYVMGTWGYRGRYLAQTEYFGDVSRIAGRWEEVAHPHGKYVVPSVTPGINVLHRGSVLTPRHILPGSGSMTTLEAQIRVLGPFVDPFLKMIMITAWNDWSSDRQIEPTVVAAPTHVDTSPSGVDYTMGVDHEGYGLKYLEIVRELLAPELAVGVTDEVTGRPSELALDQNYPNPLQRMTTIVWDIPREMEARLSLYDMLGRRVRVLASGFMPPGHHSIALDGSGLPAGVYNLRLSANGENRDRQIVIVH